MYTDQALTDIDHDELRRRYLAEEVARDLVHSVSKTSDSIVLGVNGPWGSGKSSMVNFILQYVEAFSKEQEKGIVVLQFNPWMFSGQKELQSIFFKELLIKLGRRKGLLKKASKTLAALLGHMEWLEKFKPGAINWINLAKSVFGALSKEKNLAELKRDLDKLLIESKTKLYITIDDIDRLTPGEVADIFQLVKLNGNFANTVFILAYDESTVVKALKRQFGANGRKYVEKIVQVDYKLPSVDKAEILEILDRRLKGVFAGHDELIAALDSFQGFHSAIFGELLITLRDVNRFVNAIRLRLPSIFRELNIGDFLKVEALRIFRPDAYKFILDNRDSLVRGHSFVRVVKIDPFEKKPFDTPQKRIDESGFDGITRRLLHSMFSEDSTFNRMELDNTYNDKNVCDRNFFDRYFYLQLSPREFPDRLFNEFFVKRPAEQNLISVLNEVAKTEAVNEFLRALGIRISRYNGDTYHIVKAILEFSMSVPFYWGDQRLSNSLDFVFGHCSKFMEYIESVERRRVIILEHIRKPLPFMRFSNYYMCNSILAAYNIFKDNKLGPSHKWFDLFDEERYDNDEFAKQVISEQAEGLIRIFKLTQEQMELFNEYELRFVLDHLKLSDKIGYPEKIRRLIKESKGFLRVLRISIATSYRSINDVMGYRFDKDQIFEGISTHELLEG